MDGFVPSPGLTSAQYAVSPYSSIYDPDRLELNALCEGMVPHSNPSMDSVYMDDFCNLDDNFENSSLKSFLTADVIDSLKAPARESIPTTEISWESKAQKIPVSCGADAGINGVGHNPTLAQLNTFFDNDILSLDQETSKLSDSSNDFFYDIKNSPSYRLVAQSQLSPSPFDAVSPVTISTSFESTAQTSEALSSVGTNYMRNYAPMKNTYFPPRQSNPPLVGVVAPVKQPGVTPQSSFTSKIIKQEQKMKPISQPSQLLQELLCKSPSSSVVKSERGDSSAKQKFPIVSHGGSDMQAQIVPSSDLRKRDAEGNLKSQRCGLSGSLVKREFTEETWKDIESLIEEDKLEESPKRRRCDSGSSGHISNDEEDEEEEDASSMYGGNNGGDDSDDDLSDIDADLTSVRPQDQESLIPQNNSIVGGKKQQKPVQYFWQYNVQAKGPKGTRLKLAVETPADPHILNDFEDPVFDECNTSIAGIRHGGKARKGDGNEITPNPRKLYLIGLQLARLNKRINACCLQINSSSGSGVSQAQRNESRKEKNKLASRACRLKKKAQHEANKIKLHGLALEHRQLNTVSTSVWAQLKERAKAILARSNQNSGSSLASTCGPQIDQALDHTETKVAGHSIDYVNSVILKVESGDLEGGLNIGKKRQQKSS